MLQDPSFISSTYLARPAQFRPKGRLEGFIQPSKTPLSSTSRTSHGLCRKRWSVSFDKNGAYVYHSTISRTLKRRCWKEKNTQHTTFVLEREGAVVTLKPSFADGRRVNTSLECLVPQRQVVMMDNAQHTLQPLYRGSKLPARL